MIINTNHKLLDFLIIFASFLYHFDSAFIIFTIPVLSEIIAEEFGYASSLAIFLSALPIGAIFKPIGFALIYKFTKHIKINSIISTSIILLINIILLRYLTIFYLDNVTYLIFFYFALEFMKQICAPIFSSIGSYIIIENKSKNIAIKYTYLHQASTILGILIASILALKLNIHTPYLSIWIIMLILLFNFIIYIALNSCNSINKFTFSFKDKLLDESNIEGSNLNFLRYNLNIIRKNRHIIVPIICAYSISYTTYALSFIIISNLYSLFTNHTHEQINYYLPYFLIADFALVLITGKIYERYNFTSWKRILNYSALILTISIIPLMLFIAKFDLTYISLIRAWFIMIGVVFSVALPLYVKTKLDLNKHRYYIKGMSYFLGSIIGKTHPFICALLLSYGAHHFSIALYLSITLAIATLGLNLSK